MQLLFKREQFSGIRGRVKFKLWGKVELDDNEQEIVLRYTFDKAILIEAIQPGLLRKSLIVGIIAGILTYIIAIILFSFDGYIRLYSDTAVFSAMIASVAVGYWYYNDRRETIYVRDLIHGRYFTCNSVIDLARKEAWLQTVTSYLRQVMESAKHWDGTESHSIEPLPKDEARRFIIKGL
jgi:hypothetical protein